MTYGPGVRAQVFEVIVRQALAGAPWRELCAGPMRVNDIDPEEVEYEVNRRLGKELLTDQQRHQVDDYLKRWEVMVSGTEQPNTAVIEELVEQFCEKSDLQRPTLVLCESPAMLCFYFYCMAEPNRRASSPFDLAAQIAPLLSQHQSESFQLSLTEHLKALPNCDFDGTKDFLTAPLQSDYNALSARMTNQMSASLSEDLFKFFKFGFKIITNRFTSRVRTIYDVTRNTINTQALTENAGRRPVHLLGLPMPLFEGFAPNTFSIWEAKDLLTYAFAREHLCDVVKFDTELQEKLDIWLNLFKAAPWYSFYRNVCFVGMYPRTTSFDEQFRLSSRSGPAITFADGYEVFAVEGIVVPRKLIESPNTISISDIDQQENAAVRRMMVDTYGAARYIQGSAAVLVHEDECGQLYQKEMAGDEPLLMVRVRNSTPEADGSFKFYFLRVPPNMRTAREAVAWTFNVSPREYKPEVES